MIKEEIIQFLKDENLGLNQYLEELILNTNNLKQQLELAKKDCQPLELYFNFTEALHQILEEYRNRTIDEKTLKKKVKNLLKNLPNQ